MKKLTTKLISFILMVVMVFTTTIPAFAHNIPNKDYVQVVETGVYINDVYYSRAEFTVLLDTAVEQETLQTRSVIAIAAGTWYIPGIGQVVVTTAGVIIVGGAIIKAGSWLYNTISDWFAERAEIKAVEAKIPSRLKKPNGNVDLDQFNEKVRGKQEYKEDGGWSIDKDRGNGHGGSKWKLKDKKGDRVGTLDENGKVLRR